VATGHKGQTHILWTEFLVFDLRTKILQDIRAKTTIDLLQKLVKCRQQSNVVLFRHSNNKQCCRGRNDTPCLQTKAWEDTTEYDIPC
jgi:hypothetical protein